MSAIDPAVKLPIDPMGVALSFLTPTELAVCNRLSKPWQKQTDKESLWKEAVLKKLKTYGNTVKIEEEIVSGKKMAKALILIEKKVQKENLKDTSHKKIELTINNKILFYSYCYSRRGSTTISQPV